MYNPRLAGRYAKSLIDLAIEKGQLETVYKDMLYLQAVCRNSREFVNVLRSPVIKADKKEKILEAVTNGNIGELTKTFNRLMVNKGRESSLPEIADAFIDSYNKIKGISKVKLTTAQPVSEELKNSIIGKIKSTTPMQNVELETVADEALIGGFVLEFNNNLVDASIARDLKDIKKQFQENVYVQNIR
ncbi:MAG TPA: ATP synthase F1 subunit delta [Chitinophagaceae bacterium]|nr:ATP synthase F1 subunit delta [Chitinophagaceae bacterium]